MVTCIIFYLFFQPSSVNTALVARIDSMFKEDQRWRIEAMKIRRKEKSDYDEDTVNSRWVKVDSLNEVKAKNIIKHYGFPGFSLVGEAGSSRFWAIIQHCDDDIPFQEEVLRLMKIQLAKNNASKKNYAYLLDRVLVSKNQRQVYGTQCHLNAKTHQFEPFPLQYPSKVDALRKSVGLEPLAIYVKSLN